MSIVTHKTFFIVSSFRTCYGSCTLYCTVGYYNAHVYFDKKQSKAADIECSSAAQGLQSTASLQQERDEEHMRHPFSAREKRL